MKETSSYRAVSRSSLANHAGTITGAIAGALMGGPVAIAAATRAPGYFEKDEEERKRVRRRNLFLGALTGFATGGVTGGVFDIKRHEARAAAADRAAMEAISSMKTAGSLLDSIKSFRPFDPNNLNATGGIGGAAIGVGAGGLVGGILGGLSGTGVLRGAAVGAGLGGVAGGAGGYAVGKREIPKVLDRFKDRAYMDKSPLFKAIVPKSIHSAGADNYVRNMTIGDIWRKFRQKGSELVAPPPQT